MIFEMARIISLLKWPLLAAKSILPREFRQAKGPFQQHKGCG
jgi:hypothetical protein